MLIYSTTERRNDRFPPSGTRSREMQRAPCCRLARRDERVFVTRALEILSGKRLANGEKD